MQSLLQVRKLCHENISIAVTNFNLEILIFMFLAILHKT